MVNLLKKFTGIRNYIVSRNIGRYRSRIFRSYVIISFASFLVLAIFSRRMPYFSFDLVISREIQKITLPGFDGLMKFVSVPGYSPNLPIIIALVIVILLLNKLKWETVCLLINSIGYAVLEFFFKDLIHRSRPAEDLVNVFLPLKGYSFPSGHVLGYTAVFGFILFLIYTHMPKSRVRTIAIATLILLIVLVSFSRVYLGEHWPSDTLGSYLLGSAVLLSTIELYIWGRPKYFKSDPTIKPAVASHINP